MRVPPSWCAAWRARAGGPPPHVPRAHSPGQLLDLPRQELDPRQFVRTPPVVGQARGRPALRRAASEEGRAGRRAARPRGESECPDDPGYASEHDIGRQREGRDPTLPWRGAGHADIVRALLAGGADPSIATDAGTAPLHVATWGGDPYFRDWTDEEETNLLDVTRLLVDLGADVNSAGEHGWTALHGAAYKGVDPIVRFLVGRGARMDVFDEYGQTPLSIASAVITQQAVARASPRGSQFDSTDSWPDEARPDGIRTDDVE